MTLVTGYNIIIASTLVKLELHVIGRVKVRGVVKPLPSRLVHLQVVVAVLHCSESRVHHDLGLCVGGTHLLLRLTCLHALSRVEVVVPPFFFRNYFVRLRHLHVDSLHLVAHSSVLPVHVLKVLLAVSRNPILAAHVLVHVLLRFVEGISGGVRTVLVYIY